MIKTIIVDDEQHCINRLIRLIESQDKYNVQVLGTFHSVEEALFNIQKLKPGLVFLDVQLNDETGFDLLKNLPEIDFEVIFTTAYEKYALQAIKFSAIDYLLKPIEDVDFVQSLDRFQEKISKDDLSGKYETLFHNLKNLQGQSKRISIPTSKGFNFIQVSDIIRCQADINYTTLFLQDKRKITVAKTLKDFEEMLSGYDFFRIHNSHLINLSCVVSYNKGKGGFVTMADGSEIEVATRRKEEFLKRISL